MIKKRDMQVIFLTNRSISNTIMELVSRNNPCGWSLVTLVSRGSSIIAEIQRLSQYIPEDFTFPKTQINHPYARILYDYSYFGHETEIENEIENNRELYELNEECRETHIEIVTRFCRLFESIVRYALDFLHFLEQLDQHVFLQITVESLLNETQGKQLLGEALYYYGVMLLQLDYHIPGLVRERLLVAFNRWRGSSMLLNYSKVCEVCRSSGYVVGQPYPMGYPLEFVNRLEIPVNFVNVLIGRYRNDDVYLMLQNYPEAEHRSVALSQQASMLFIFLFFSPKTLADENFIMREIVDKFFFDNWIIPYFMGDVVDLSVIWKDFKAANIAIQNTIKQNSQRYAQRYTELSQPIHNKIKQVLSDGFTKIEQLLDGINDFVKLLRDANVCIKFLLLHTQEPGKKVQYPYPRDPLLAFLLDLGEFEFELKNAVENALNTKPEIWNDTKNNAVQILKQLALSFSGTLALDSLQKDEKLQQWFNNMSGEVNILEIDSSVGNVQKIYQLTSALESILPFHQISNSIFIKESVAKVITCLKTMARLLHVDEKYVPLIGTLCDFSYGFGLVRNFIPLMQKRIKKDPFSVLKLRATFLKMTSILDLQLVRIVQSESKDVESVSEHYSNIIVQFVRDVLEIVPISIFGVLDQIIQLRTNVLKELPNRIERAQLKQYAQLEERAKLAHLTKEISILTSGVLAMKTTLMGVITVDPKQMLEEGIRKQLVKKIIHVLYQQLVPTSKKQEQITPERFNQIIDSVGKAIDGIRHSFEYMGDYVNIDGLRIWHHEYSRIMCFLVEQESNKFVKKKILGWQSEYQSKVAPINIPKMEGRFATCIGSLAFSLIDLTRQTNSVYCGITGGWLNPQTGEEVLGTKTIDRLCNAIGIEGTSSIDLLLSFTLARQLRQFFERFERGSFGNYNGLLNKLLDMWPSPPESIDVFNDLLVKVKPLSHEWTILICSIGQLQLLKMTIDAHMELKCKLEAESLNFMLDNTNTTVLQAIKQFYRDPTHNPYPSSNLIAALSTYLENCGMCRPLEKIYTMSKPLPEISLVILALTLLNLNNVKLMELDRLHMLYRPQIYAHFEFIVGIITILRQLNVNHQYAYLTFIGQYANILLAQAKTIGKLEYTSGVEIPRSLKYLMIFIKDYENLTNTPRRMVDTFIPPTIFDFLSI